MHGRWLKALLVALPLLGWTAASAGCGPDLVDLQETLEVTEVSTGWSEGEKDGRTRIVPTIAFQLRKQAADTSLDRVSLSINFLKPGDEHLDDIYLQRVALGPEGSEPLTVRADTGYAGDAPQTAAELLQHAEFRDISVRILARQTSGRWIELYTGPIDRRLLGR